MEDLVGRRRGRAMENLVGQRFGRILVIALNGRDGKRREYWWDCLCDCGVKKIIRGDNLKTGITRSCGCLKNEISRNRWLKPVGEGSANQIINSYKQCAIKRGIPFELSREQALNIMSKNCAYCGRPPENKKYSPYSNGDFIYSGIDRVDSAKGYTLENTAPCCKRCNSGKSDMPLEEFISWIDEVYKFQHPA